MPLWQPQAAQLLIWRLGIRPLIGGPGFRGVPIATLTDDFTTQDNAKWTYGTGASVSSGQLVEATSSSYAGSIASVNQYDLTGSAITVQLAQRPNLGNGTTQAFVALDVNFVANQNTLQFDLTGTTLTAYQVVGGVFAAAGSVTYSATSHQWLRIRESAGTVFWDTSADGSTWANLASWVPTFSATGMSVRIGTGYSGTEPSPGSATWDNFNLLPVNTTPVPVTDAATGTDAVTVAAQATLADTGAGADAVTVTAAVPTADSATATDATAVAVQVPLTDSGVGADSATVRAAIPLADSGTAVDSLTVTARVTLADTLAGADNLTVTGSSSPVVTDSATGTDALTVTATAPLTDTGTVADALTVTARIGLTDTGSAADALAVTVRVPLTDVGTGTDSAVAQGPTYVTHTYVTAVLADLSATATLAGNGTSTAVLAAQQLATATLTASPPSVATLAATATSTAALAGDGTSTAALADRAALSILQTTT